MKWKCHGGRKVILAPDGSDACAGEAAAGFYRFRSAGEMGEAEGVTCSFVNRLLRLTLLDPSIQESILDGRQPNGMMCDRLTGSLSNVWDEQRKRFARP